MKRQQVNEISHRGFCRMDNNYMSTGQVFGSPRPTALKLFLEKVFSSDHNNKLKWAILGAKCACHLSRIFYRA